MNARGTRLAGALGRFTEFTCLLAIVIGAGGLLGWALGLSLLITLLPGQVAIAPITAVCFILLGAGLWIRRAPDGVVWAKRTASMLGLVVAIVGAIGLVEDLFSWNTGIRELLFSERTRAATSVRPPGAMAPITALCLCLFGISLSSLDWRSRGGTWPAQYLSLVGAAAALFGVLDYPFDPQVSQTYMAVQTAVGLLMFSFGMICARTDRGLGALLASPGMGGSVLRRLLPATLLVLMVAGWLRWLLEPSVLSDWSAVAWTIMALIVVLVGLVIWAARTIDRMDHAQRAADRQLQLRVRSLLEVSVDLLVASDLAGTITDVNAATERVTGVAREQLIGSSLPDYFTEPDAARQALSKLLAHGSVRDEAMIIRHVSGKLTEVRFSAAVLRNEAGEADGIFAAARDVTEQKRAEDVLAAERAKLHETATAFRTLAESVPQLVWFCAPDGSNIYFNQQWFDYTGLTPEESHGRGWNTPFHPDDKQPAWDAWNQAVATGGIYRIECRLRAADGSYRWFLTRGVAQRDASGSIVRWFGTCTDIESLKCAEAELRAVQQELRTLNAELEARVKQRAVQLEDANKWLGVAERGATAGFWSWDLVSGKLTWTDALFELFGRSSREQPSFELWKQVMHPDDHERAQAGLQRSLEAGTPLENEYRVILPSGTERWIRAIGSIAYDEAGRAQRMSGICIDVTERKRVEDAIRELNDDLHRRAAELQTILDTVPIGIAISKDLEGQHIVGNPALERMLGVGSGAEVSKSMPGVPYRVLQGGRELAPEELPIQRVARGASATANETMEIVRQDGRVITLLASAAALFDERGRPRGAVGAYVDVTEEKRAERELRERSDQLAAVNTELNTFNYAVAHDLRGPLRHIHSFAEILAEEADPVLSESSKQLLSKIRESARQMTQLLEDLLNLALLGRQELNVRASALNPMVEDVIRGLELETRGRQVEWRIARLPTVECDPALLRQVFVNLLSNALKFTKPRRHAIIEVAQTLLDGEPVVFVRDNGVGFSMKYADRLFGLFQRLHLQQDFDGTGVGLAIVQRIMRKHGGRAWAEAEVDKGATLYLGFRAGLAANAVQSPSQTAG